MDNSRVVPSLIICIWLIILLLGGCASTAPTRFYILNALATSDRLQPPADSHDVIIAVGPVDLPRYLDRPQIVTREGQNGLQVAEFDQWAEPLQDSVIRVLVENLSHLLATDSIVIDPGPRSVPIAYQVVIRMTQFEGTRGEKIRLTARWQIVDAKAQRELVRKSSSFEVPVETSNYAALVTALNQGLDDLSRTIASAVRTVAPDGSARK